MTSKPPTSNIEAFVTLHLCQLWGQHCNTVSAMDFVVAMELSLLYSVFVLSLSMKPLTSQQTADLPIGCISWHTIGAARQPPFPS